MLQHVSTPTLAVLFLAVGLVTLTLPKKEMTVYQDKALSNSQESQDYILRCLNTSVIKSDIEEGVRICESQAKELFGDTIFYGASAFGAVRFCITDNIKSTQSCLKENYH